MPLLTRPWVEPSWARTSSAKRSIAAGSARSSDMKRTARSVALEFGGGLTAFVLQHVTEKLSVHRAARRPAQWRDRHCVPHP